LASFAPNTEVSSGREYDFKGAEPNLGIATAIKGVTRIAGDAIDAGYQLVVDDIQQRAFKGEDAIQQNLFATSDLAAAQSSTTNAGVARPEELVRGVGKMQQLKNAYTKGAITETDYLSSIDVLARKMRSRYGELWSKEIDDAVAGAVSNSANAYRRQLFQEWDANKTASDKAAEEEDKWKWQFVKENAVDLSSFPDMLQNPNKYSRGDLIKASLRNRVPRQAVEDALKTHQANKASGEATDESTLKTAKSVVQGFLSTFYDSATTAAMPAFKEKVAKYGADGEYSKDEIQELFTSWRAIAPEIEGGIKQIVLDQFPEMPEASKKEVYAMGEAMNEFFSNMMTSPKGTGVLDFASKMRDIAGDEVIAQLTKGSPDFASAVALTNGMNKVGLGEFFKDDIGLKLKERTPDLFKTKGAFVGGQILAGEANMNEFTQLVWENQKNPKLLKETVDYIKRAIVSPKSTPEGRRHAAKVLFAPENVAYMSPEMVDPRLATEFFNELSTPEVQQTMIKLKDTDPQTWVNYYDWTFDRGFKAVFGSEINNVTKQDPLFGDQVSKGLDMKFDTNRNQFTFKDLKSMAPPKTAEELALRMQIEAGAVTALRLNRWIKRVEPLIKSEGLDPKEQLIDMFVANGVPIDGKQNLLGVAASMIKRKFDEENPPEETPAP
jgi:hypothetical protein